MPPPGLDEAGRRAARIEPGQRSSNVEAAPGSSDVQPGPEPSDTDAGPGTPGDDDLAAATAARGFLATRWLGALLMVYSFTHLYVFGLRPGASVMQAYVVAGVSLGVGTLMWWRSRTYAERLEFPWGAKWGLAADLFACTAIVFWILLVLALWLVSQGVALF